jgi:hypothetical protein
LILITPIISKFVLITCQAVGVVNAPSSSEVPASCFVV